MCSIGAGEGFRRREGCKDGGDAFHLFSEAHVVIPFVAYRIVTYTVCDGMVGHFEAGVPVRVDRPVRLEVAADTIEESLSRFALWNLYSVVDAADADSFFRKFTEFLQVLHGGVPAAAVCVDDDSICSIEYGFVLRPAVRDDGGFESGTGLREVVGEKHGARAVLVCAAAVACLSGDEYDLGFPRFFLLLRGGCEE